MSLIESPSKDLVKPADIDTSTNVIDASNDEVVLTALSQSQLRTPPKEEKSPDKHMLVSEAKTDGQSVTIVAFQADNDETSLDDTECEPIIIPGDSDMINEQL